MTADEVVDAMYQSMSFELGERPDFARQGEVFAEDARLVRVNDDGVFEFDPRSFRQNYEAMIDSGALPSFMKRKSGGRRTNSLTSRMCSPRTRCVARATAS